MNVWLVYPYGSMPNEGLRPDRPSMVGQALANAGHEVTWWGSNIEHRTKAVRSHDWKDIHVAPGFTIRIVPTTPYKKNISLARIRHEQSFGNQLYRRASLHARPDVILIGEPTLFGYKPVLRLASEVGAKVVVDRLDLWPELFHMVLPGPLQKFGRLAFAGLYAARRALYQRADAVIAGSESYLEAALELVPTLPRNRTATVYYGIDVADHRATANRPGEIPEALRALRKRDDEIWAICATTLGNNYDIKTLLEAGKLLEARSARIKVLIAGTGPLKDYVVSYIAKHGLRETVYLGNPDAETTSRIYRSCDVGLSVYRKSSTVSMPIKAFHYFAAGLPTVNCLGGDLRKILRERRMGVPYEAEDAESLAAALEVMASDPDNRRQMGRNAYEMAAEFDCEVQYSKLVALIEQVGNVDSGRADEAHLKRRSSIG